MKHGHSVYHLTIVVVIDLCMLRTHCPYHFHRPFLQLYVSSNQGAIDVAQVLKSGSDGGLSRRTVVVYFRVILAKLTVCFVDVSS